MKSRLSGFLFFVIVLCPHIVSSKDTARTDSLDSILTTIQNPDEKVDMILKFLEKPENQFIGSAIGLANRAYEIAQHTNYVSGRVNSMIVLGSYYFRIGDYKRAMEFAQKSREMSEDLNLDKELANSLLLIGKIYSELGDYDNSSQYYFRSLKLFEKIGDKEGIARSNGDIGLDFYSQQYFKKALEYYGNALTIAREIRNQSLIKKQYNNIAVVYGDLQQYDTAIVFLRKALSISVKLGDKLGEGVNIMNIGYIQMNKGKYDDALVSFQQSLGLLTALSNNIHLAECHLNIAYCLYSADRIEESVGYFKKALVEGQTQGYYTIINKAAKMLNQVYTSKNDSENAYKYILIEKSSLDSLYVSQKQDLLSKHELQYIYDKKEFERQLAQKAKETILLVIIFGLVSGLVILMLIFSRYRLKSRIVVVEKEKIELEKERFKSELIIKDKELTVNLISLIKKNEFLTDISNKLTHLERNAAGRETRDAIAKIGQELRTSTDDKLFNEFSQRFQEVHAGFYEKLLSTYPELTQNELKLCAFLRLNMSTKDIAELTGQQLPSIDKARYRLRKKLSLSGSEANLVTFLSQI